MKKLWIFAFLLGSAAPAQAVIAELDKYDSQAAYGVFESSAVLYVDKCARQKFDRYEWKTWEGYYRVRCYLEPLATITVKKESTERILDSTLPFIDKAIEASGKAGGNLLCVLNLKKAPKELGIESMTFRSYRQVFQCGYKELENYYLGIMAGKGNPITLQDIQR